MSDLTAEGLEILWHSLGLDHGRGQAYRNRFCAGGKDVEKCRALVTLGYMVEHPASDMTGRDPLFTVTESGVKRARQ